MTHIVTLQLSKGLEINLIHKSKKLAYTFEVNGKEYGNAVKLTSTKVTDILAASFQLFINALETKEAVDKLHGK